MNIQPAHGTPAQVVADQIAETKRVLTAAGFFMSEAERLALVNQVALMAFLLDDRARVPFGPAAILDTRPEPAPPPKKKRRKHDKHKRGRR